MYGFAESDFEFHWSELPSVTADYWTWVGDITTPGEDWVTAELGPVSAGLVARLQEHGFDQAPVQVPGSPIGWRLVATRTLKELLQRGEPLTPASEFMTGDTAAIPDGFVEPRVVMESISPARATILYTQNPPNLPSSEQQPPTRFKRVGPRLDGVIWGMLTLSDLNNRALRATLFAMLMDLEKGLAQVVGQLHSEPREWIMYLREEAKISVLGQWELARQQGLDLDPIAYTYLRDLIEIAARSPAIRSKLGYPSKGPLYDALGRINSLRNRIMHSVRPLVLSAEEAAKVRDAVASAVHMLETLKRSEAVANDDDP